MFAYMQKIENNKLKMLRELRITKVDWNLNLSSIGFTLNNGQSCKAGNKDFNLSHSFDPAMKIT